MNKGQKAVLRSGMPGFAPVVDEGSRVLILGSYPSPKSFEERFYYGHPHNRFWPLMANLLQQNVPQSTTEKEELILQNRLALWDVLESCTIRGASDATITDVVVNDIGSLVEKYSIQAVFCNGGTAYKYYQRYCAKLTLAVYSMPSTSPANARFTIEKLIESWRVILPYIEKSVQ